MKKSVDDLAIFGGPPAFAEKLHVGRPNIPPRAKLLERIGDMLDRRWLTNAGPFVGEFEARIAALAGVRHCIAMCNATVALEIAIRAAGLHGEVILPSFTFVATAHALQWQEITPVFCDVDPTTHNIDPRRAEELITPRTTGIIGVHLWGRPCNVEELSSLCSRRGLTLLFDAAHGLACSHRGKMIGNFGAAEVFSFHATKLINTFEGGAVVTNSDELAAGIRLMKNFGFVHYDRVESIGTNGKMSEVSAAMGLSSLECLDDIIDVNRRHYTACRESLAGLTGLSLVPYDESERCNYQYIVLEIDEPRAGLSRDDLLEVLWAENVLARRYFYPGCHRMQPYRTLYPEAGKVLPETERLVDRVLCLPTGTAVTSAEIERVCGIIRFAFENAGALRQRLGGRPR